MNTTTLKSYGVQFAVMLTLLLGGVCVNIVFAADTTSRLDAYHAENGITCADCHSNESKREAVGMLKCMECHDLEELAEATAEIQPTNPHNNRHYSIQTDCNYCHHQHQKSENFCLPCHARFEFDVP